MAVGHDVTSESHTGTTGVASVASFNWTHASSVDAQGFLVFCFNDSSGTDVFGTVTVDGVNVPAVTGGFAADTTGEPRSVKAYFLGSGVPTTNNPTVVVNRTNNADVTWATSTTVTAATVTEVYTAGIVLLQGDGAFAEQSVDDGTPGTNSMRFAAASSALNAVPGNGANSTGIAAIDFGTTVAQVMRETTAGQGSRSVGFQNATSDDRAAVHLAVRETPVTGPTTTTVAAPAAIPAPTVAAVTPVAPSTVAAVTGVGAGPAIRNSGAGNSGDTVTTANAAAGSTQWDTVSIGASSTITYDTKTGIGDAIKLAKTAGTANNFLEWDGALPSGNTQYGGMYFWYDSLPTNSQNFVQYQATAGTIGGRLRIRRENGQIELIDKDNLVVGTSVTELAASTLYRLEWVYVGNSTTAGSWDLYIFAGTSGEPLEIVSASSVNMTATQPSVIRIGYFGGTSNAWAFWANQFETSQSAIPSRRTVTITLNAPVSANVTPTTVAVVAAIATPTVTGTAEATPSTVAGVTAIPTPTVTGTAAVTATTVAVTAAISAPTVSVNAAITTTTVAAVTSVPTPAVVGTAAVTTTTVAITAAVPSPTVAATAAVTTTTVARVVAMSTPTVAATAAVTTTTVAVIAGVPSATITTDSSTSVSLSPVLRAVAIATPTVAVTQNPSVTTSTVTAVVSVPTPTVAATAAVTTTTVARSVAIATPAISTTVAVTTTTVARAVAVATPTVTGTAALTTTTVSRAVAVATPVISTTTDVTTTTVARSVAIATPAVTALTPVTTSTVAADAAVPTPDVEVTSTASITPARVARAVAIPTPSVVVTSTASVTPETVGATVAVATPTIVGGADIAITTSTVAAVVGVPVPEPSAAVDIMPDAVAASVAIFQVLIDAAVIIPITGITTAGGVSTATTATGVATQTYSRG